MSVRIVNDEAYTDRETAAFVCMDHGAFGVGEGLDAAAYCLDAVERIPAGSACRFESDVMGVVYAMGRLSFR